MYDNRQKAFTIAQCKYGVFRWAKNINFIFNYIRKLIQWKADRQMRSKVKVLSCLRARGQTNCYILMMEVTYAV